jgi:hypothetical protein
MSLRYTERSPPWRGLVLRRGQRPQTRASRAIRRASSSREPWWQCCSGRHHSSRDRAPQNATPHHSIQSSSVGMNPLRPYSASVPRRSPGESRADRGPQDATPHHGTQSCPLGTNPLRPCWAHVPRLGPGSGVKASGAIRRASPSCETCWSCGRGRQHERREQQRAGPGARGTRRRRADGSAPEARPVGSAAAGQGEADDDGPHPAAGRRGCSPCRWGDDFKSALPRPPLLPPAPQRPVVYERARGRRGGGPAGDSR